MAMSSEDWQAVKAKISQMEQVVQALRKLRAEPSALPESVLQAIDGAITETERRIAAIKNTMVD